MPRWKSVRQFLPGRLAGAGSDEVDVHAIRQVEQLSQEAFAKRYGFSPAVVRNWEQGRRRPNRAARILLMLIRSEPEAVRRVLGYAEAARRVDN